MYLDVGCNMWAIGKILEAMRGIERWGGGEILDRMFTGFAALPNPDNVQSQWRSILRYDGHNLQEAKSAFKAMRKKCHPDHGGTDIEFNLVMKSWEQCQQELSA